MRALKWNCVPVFRHEQLLQREDGSFAPMDSAEFVDSALKATPVHRATIIANFVVSVDGKPDKPIGHYVSVVSNVWPLDDGVWQEMATTFAKGLAEAVCTAADGRAHEIEVAHK